MLSAAMDAVYEIEECNVEVTALLLTHASISLSRFKAVIRM